jgi:hypothetical protein
MSDTASDRLDPGFVTATPGDLKAIRQAGQTPIEFLNRHTSGD